MAIAHDRHPGAEHAIPRLDQGHREIKWLPRLDPFEQHYGIFQTALGVHDEVAQETPPLPVRNPPTIGRVWERNEIERFRVRNGARQGHSSFK